MTENEKESICGLNFLKEKLYNGIYADRLDCIDSAIYALKEIQRYREIGASPERLKELIFEGSAAKRILRHYQEIGTVEECQKAVEKLPKTEEVVRKLLCGDYSSPCMFCVYGKDNDAECCNIGGGQSWCYKNAQWNGKESEEE